MHGGSDSYSDLTDAHFMPDEFSDWSDELDPPSNEREPRIRPRCCLCYFKFETHDPIVVFNPKNLHSVETWAGEYVEPERFEWDLENGYHSECVDLVAKSLPLGNSLQRTILDRTSHEVGYTKLLPSVEADRIRRLKKMFAQEFIVIIGYRLPLEICENIGRYCLSEYATKLINDVWTNKDFPGPRDLAIRVNASRSIWAQRVEFEGRQYIKSFSTTRKSESDTKLFEAIPGIRASVYFAVDLLGIRKVAITQDDNTPSLNQGDGLRWVVNRQKDLPFSIKVKSDLVDVSSSQPEGVWVYIPVDRDERIAELWFRKEDPDSISTLPEHRFPKHRSLLVRTNKGRGFVVGTFIKEACNLTYQLIATFPPAGPSRMLYCKTKGGKIWLGFEQATTWEQHNIAVSFPEKSKFSIYSSMAILASTAELRDVRTVTVCRGWRHEWNAGIIGMLLTYADGHQQSLGQIRLDRMEAPLTITSGKIWLGCDKSEMETLIEGFWPPTGRIKWVDMDKPLQHEDREYLELPLTGSLEWQSRTNWSHHSHSVCHHESRVPPGEMDLVLAREAESGGRPQGVFKTFSVVV
ncbi:hypothetical protein FPHYL_285 [Fusarium phyllophilum]|uniref:Uncharacterized protein n=1 Tax=Fusarium phyllophilum TaxID=47803 RepID=A0A8H5NMZ5_9HYPO|nr:hypothetical protein FPHYL_285 [Fusarium phyllophilum]